MGFKAKIIKSDTIIPLNGIFMIFYGQQGTGKTSLAYTGKNVLLCSFERDGLARANRTDNADALDVSNWDDLPDANDPDLEEYDTIVIDTLASAVDKCLGSITKGKNPSIKDFGTLKTNFLVKVRSYMDLGKNVVFLAHEDDNTSRQTVSKGEIAYIHLNGGMGKSKNDILNNAHCIAFMEKESNAVNIFFNGGSNVFTKNSCGMKNYTFTKNDKQMLSTIFDDFKAKYSEFQEAGLQLKELQRNTINIVESVSSMENPSEQDQSAMFDVLDSLPVQIKAITKQDCMRIFSEKGFLFDKNTKLFVKQNQIATEDQQVDEAIEE